eukprot:6175815-Pleurochrysis_carterae.AAC.1
MVMTSSYYARTISIPNYGTYLGCARTVSRRRVSRHHIGAATRGVADRTGASQHTQHCPRSPRGAAHTAVAQRIGGDFTRRGNSVGRMQTSQTLLLLLLTATYALRSPSMGDVQSTHAVRHPPVLCSISARGKPTNAVINTVNGVRRKRLGGTDIEVSEIGLGTQRWGSKDFNAPDLELCHTLLDRAVLDSGVNLIDTAEQYPIPSDWRRPEGSTERIIGSWLAKDATRREQVVIASKITGGINVDAVNIEKDLAVRGSHPTLTRSVSYLLHDCTASVEGCLLLACHDEKFGYACTHLRGMRHMQAIAGPSLYFTEMHIRTCYCKRFRLLCQSPLETLEL